VLGRNRSTRRTTSYACMWNCYALPKPSSCGVVNLWATSPCV
jgi:hypothetical protein